MSKRLFTGAFVVSVFVLTAVELVRTRTILSSRSTRKRIPAPAQWVPFSADFTMIRPRHVTLAGHFFRAADGSTRRDLEVPGNPPRTMTTIYNVSTHRIYSGHGAHWRASSFPARAFHAAPPQILAANPGYVKYHWRLALKQGDDGSLRSSAGFSAYSHRDQYGQVTLMVPALNWFVVVTQRVDFSMTYSNIAVGPQPGSLFQPPAGADVVFSSGHPLRSVGVGQ